MKKIYTLSIFAVLISFSGFSQSAYKLNDITVINKNIPEVDLLSNPVRGAINLKISNPNSTMYNMVLYSTTGQKITSLEYNHQGGINTETMYVPSGINGMFYLVVRTKDKQTSLKVFIES